MEQDYIFIVYDFCEKGDFHRFRYFADGIDLCNLTAKKEIFYEAGEYFCSAVGYSRSIIFIKRSDLPGSG